MPEQVRGRRESRDTGTQNGAKPTGHLTERGAALKKNIDEVLADIDDILEENAEELVSEYVQRGGE